MRGSFIITDNSTGNHIGIAPSKSAAILIGNGALSRGAKGYRIESEYKGKRYFILSIVNKAPQPTSESK